MSRYNTRFEKEIHITHHARERMAQRQINANMLLELLETGDLRYKDQTRFWVAKAFVSRSDNLVCAAVIMEDKLIVKTVMHHFAWEEQS